MIAKLAGKISLVTGSTSGIGLACAQELARAGSHVCLSGFGDPKVIKQLQQDIETQFKVKAIYENHDLRNKSGVKDMISNVQKRLGGIDILVNNAGMQFVTETENFPDDKYHDIINLNLNSYFHAAKLVIPEMKRKNWGRIINVASAHGKFFSPRGGFWGRGVGPGVGRGVGVKFGSGTGVGVGVGLKLGVKLGLGSDYVVDQPFFKM